MDWADRLAGTNINPVTLLATDYLNHFNEVVMILDMLADMPDCVDEVVNWRPMTYAEHFQHSALAYRDMAVEAYIHAPYKYRHSLGLAVARLNAKIVAISADVAQAHLNHMEIDFARDAAEPLRRLIALAGKIINGALTLKNDADLDAQLSGANNQQQSQDTIDSLFD